MFGLIYGLFVGTGLFGHKIKTDIYDINEREKAKFKRDYGMNRAGVYTDYKGRTRDIDTGELRMVWPDKYGDVWVEDFKGNKLRNITQERLMDEAKERSMKAPEDRAVEYAFWGWSDSKRKLDQHYPIMGDIFIDVRTGELYVTRTIEWFVENGYRGNSISDYSKSKHLTKKMAEFYMRLSDAMLVDVSDKYKKMEKIGNWITSEKEIKNFIEFFNEKQNQVGSWYNAYDYERINELTPLLKKYILADTERDKYLYSYQ